jgi:hypothetical protein
MPAAASPVAAVRGRCRSRRADVRGRLHREIGAFRFDPLGYVLFAFPWGVAGTAQADEEGPEPWQRDILERLGKSLLSDSSGVLSPSEALRIAVASGHGIGKSALVAWIILWALSTLRDTRGIVSANTEGQLRTKTWPELAKWYGLCLNRSWFERGRIRLRRFRRHPARAQGRHEAARPCLARRRRRAGAHLRLSSGHARLVRGAGASDRRRPSPPQATRGFDGAAGSSSLACSA